MERNVRTDLEACCEADLRFHASVIAASHNVVLKGLTGTIEAALRATFTITNRLMTAQSRSPRIGRFSSAGACATPRGPGLRRSTCSASPRTTSTASS